MCSFNFTFLLPQQSLQWQGSPLSLVQLLIITKTIELATSPCLSAGIHAIANLQLMCGVASLSSPKSSFFPCACAMRAREGRQRCISCQNKVTQLPITLLRGVHEISRESQLSQPYERRLYSVDISRQGKHKKRYASCIRPYSFGWCGCWTRLELLGSKEMTKAQQELGICTYRLLHVKWIRYIYYQPPPQQNAIHI